MKVLDLIVLSSRMTQTGVFQGLLERSWLVGVLSLEIVVSYVLSQVSISWFSDFHQSFEIFLICFTLGFNISSFFTDLM